MAAKCRGQFWASASAVLMSAWRNCLESFCPDVRMTKGILCVRVRSRGGKGMEGVSPLRF